MKKYGYLGFLFLLTACMGQEPVRLFSSAPEYVLDTTTFINAHAKQNMAYSFTELTYLPKKWNYPYAPWLILPNNSIPQSNNRKALLLGAIFTDISYLAHYNQIPMGKHLFSLIDSLKPAFSWFTWEAQKLYLLNSEPRKTLHTLNFIQADATLLAQEYEQKRLIYYMQIGALIESFYLCAHLSTMKADTLNVVYFLEDQKKGLQSYIQYFEEKDTLVAKMLPELYAIPDLLTLTQTVQVWDSLTNTTQEQTFALEKPLLQFQKHMMQLRKEWLLSE